MQCGDQVVVLFAGLVVHKHALLHGFNCDGAVNVLCAFICKLRRHFEGVVSAAAVAA